MTGCAPASRTSGERSLVSDVVEIGVVARDPEWLGPNGVNEGTSRLEEPCDEGLLVGRALEPDFLSLHA